MKEVPLRSSPTADSETDTAQDGLAILRSGYFSDQLRALSHLSFDPRFPETLPDPGLISRIAEISRDIEAAMGQGGLLRPKADEAAPTPESPPQRDERGREPFPIKLSELVIFTKESKVEFDRRSLNLTEQELRQKYKSEGADEERIFASHFRQKQAMAELRAALGPVRFLSRQEAKRGIPEDAKLAVALGGDNHFQFVARLISGDLPILGVNSDPHTSFGALLSLDAAAFIGFMSSLVRGEYLLEPWTRFETRLNGELLVPALCDVFLGERERMYMSRHLLEFAGVSFEQKSSGLLAVTGAGSTGWYQSASRFVFPQGDRFSPCSRYARFVNTEPSSAVINLRGRPQELPAYTSGTLVDGDSAVVHSLNDSDGIIALDSLTSRPFKRGSVVSLRLAAEPLWVVSPASCTAAAAPS